MLKIKIKLREQLYYPLQLGLRYKFADQAQQNSWIYHEVREYDGQLHVIYTVYDDSGDHFEGQIGILEHESNQIERGHYILAE